MEKKMIFTSQIFSSSLARISSFLGCLLIIPIKVSTSRKIAMTKEILFPLSRKYVYTNRMKDIEKYVSTIRKIATF